MANTAADSTSASSSSASPDKPARPMTAAEQKKQRLIAKRQAAAERTQANLIKLHEQREAKIAALQAKLEKVEEQQKSAQLAREMAARQRQQMIEANKGRKPNLTVESP